ncbi:MAG TPA: glycosyltransferase [Pyrinomonadaceae bacterium]|nr:glycosyltransferase [Pyrinomonadaceae bacterium]
MAEINQLEIPGDAQVQTPPPGIEAAPDRKRIVLTTFGSFGDIHPYIAVGLELKARGHQAVIATSPLYREKIEATGLGFHPIRPDIAPPQENIDTVLKIMDVKSGGEYLFKELLSPHIRDGYEDLRDAARDADLLVTHVITMAGPILAQKTGIPWVSTVLAPTSFFSIYDPLVPPQSPGIVHLLRLSPLLFARPFMHIAKRVSEKWVEPVYRLRAELGLPRGRHPIFEGQHSPSLVLALFSKVLGQPQPDWPRRTVVTGFPFYDKRDEESISMELAEFLDDGEPPLVFTLGSSAIFVAEDFYRESILAARKLNRRAVLLIGDARNMPKEALPEGIAAFEYAPYGQILPRAAAIVHQGGVGTTGQALRAGVPTLIVPFNHDQPDNAARIARLGVGRTIARSRYTAATAARELDRLLTDKTYAKRAAEIGRQVQSEDGARTAADEIEKFLKVKTKG